uniref:Uncharacterized protein n=1 Tax=Anguilla anguilla TaxID=7936 RepID=A0A0E9S1Y7_ANGAN
MTILYVVLHAKNSFGAMLISCPQDGNQYKETYLAQVHFI